MMVLCDFGSKQYIAKINCLKLPKIVQNDPCANSILEIVLK